MTPLPLVEPPRVPLIHLDHLWFQVSGTLCNLRCRHCFISCGPHNRSFGFLSFAEFKKAIEESVELGVKEYYFTGGEPFLNPDMISILELTLQYGPATVLTNGTVFKDEWLRRLRKADDDSPYSLEVRVSIDGPDAASNDPIRGEGTFERAMRGVRQLVAHGFLPILTVARTRDDQDEADLFRTFVEVLKANGCDRPRVKVLPTLRLGAEAGRCRGYHEDERITPEMMDGFDIGPLICSHSRTVTDRGIFSCPILIESPDFMVGTTLKSSLDPVALGHQACFTCYQFGSICTNPSLKGS